MDKGDALGLAPVVEARKCSVSVTVMADARAVMALAVVVVHIRSYFGLSLSKGDTQSCLQLTTTVDARTHSGLRGASRHCHCSRDQR